MQTTYSMLKKLFPAFLFEIGELASVVFQNGCTWDDLKRIYESNAKLAANLQKTPKLIFRALYPNNKKQNVGLALNIFDESTIAAAKYYVHNQKNALSFLHLVNNWWTAVNSKKQLSVYKLATARVRRDGKVDFFIPFSNWLDTWTQSASCFTLSKQTFNALIQTL